MDALPEMTLAFPNIASHFSPAAWSVFCKQQLESANRLLSEKPHFCGLSAGSNHYPQGSG